MDIVNHFDTIQGEGYYAGRPIRLVRLYGCNLSCEWCDTKYALKGSYREVSPEELTKEIEGHDSYLWTGGEPMLQIDAISNVINNSGNMKGAWHALETNGTILNEELAWFDWIEFSPKSLEVLEKCREYVKESRYLTSDSNEIKVVTDLDSVGADMAEHADCLMPLTTGNEFADLKTARRVWEYCVKNRMRYSPRLHLGVGML